MIGGKTVVGSFPHPVSELFCVGVSFFPSVLFSLLLTKHFWRKRMKFQLRSVFFTFTVVYSEKRCRSARFYTPQISLHIICWNCVLSYCYSSQIEWPIDKWQLSVVNLATKNMTDIVFHVSSVHKIRNDSRYDPSVRTRKISLKRVNGETISNVRFWIEKLTTGQILNPDFYNTSDIDLEFSEGVRFGACFFRKKIISAKKGCVSATF